jgi:hypothetical protein
MSRVISKSSSKETVAVIEMAYRWMVGENVRLEQENGWVLPFFCESGTIVFISRPNFEPDQCLSDSALFKQLVDQWRRERGVRSSTIDIILSHAYQSIIAMGEKAIPLILAQLESEGDDPDQWFWALQMLTRANPVKEDDEGDFSRMARSWLSWAAEKGYAWKVAAA